jgi:hypothetical protein
MVNEKDHTRVVQEAVIGNGHGLKQYLDSRQDVAQISLLERECRVCHCTEMNACVTNGTPCHWVADDLCSACAPDEQES